VASSSRPPARWPRGTARAAAPGRRLASLMPNRVDLVMHYLACFKAGLTATPLNYR
jgi:acyl-CoA synthetase (AMP-forming)/AMP-acid ligase II